MMGRTRAGRSGKPDTRPLQLLVLTAMLSGCGGGSSADKAVPPADPLAGAPLSGVFVDAAVEGLDYKTATRQGRTGPGGQFGFDTPGENISFSIGTQLLGSTYASKQVHVFALQSTGTDIDSEKALRIAQLLQTIDSDRNAANGIAIDNAARTAVQAKALDLNAPPAAWQAQISGVGSTMGRTAVTLDAAYAHAATNASVGADACAVPARNYAADLGSFSSASLSCDQRARAEAFFEDVRARMLAFESELLSDPLISSGEDIVQAGVKRATESNWAKLSFDTLIDSLELMQSSSTEGTHKLKVFSNASKFIKDIADIVAQDGVSDPLKRHEFASKVFDLISSSTACLGNELDACAKGLSLFFAEEGVAERLLGKKVTDAHITRVMLLLEAWLKVERGLRESLGEGNWAKAVQASGTAVEATVKTLTGAYLRSESEAARRDAIYNTLEIAAEGANAVLQCKGAAINYKESLSCLSTGFNYFNSRMAEIVNYGGAFIAVAAIRYEASRQQVTRLVLEELYRYGDIRPLFAANGVNFVPGSWWSGDREQKARELIGAVARRANAWPTGNITLLTRDFSGEVLDLVRVHQTLVNAMAKRYVSGDYVSCAAVKLGPAVIEGTIGTPSRVATGQNITLRVSSLGASFDALQFDWGDGRTTQQSALSATQRFDKEGSYRLSAYPIVSRGSQAKLCPRAAATLLVQNAVPSEVVLASNPGLPSDGDTALSPAQGKPSWIKTFGRAQGDTLKLDLLRHRRVTAYVSRKANEPVQTAAPSGKLTFTAGAVSCQATLAPAKPQQTDTRPNTTIAVASCELPAGPPARSASLQVRYEGDARHAASSWQGFADLRVFGGDALKLNSIALQNDGSYLLKGSSVIANGVSNAPVGPVSIIDNICQDSGAYRVFTTPLSSQGSFELRWAPPAPMKRALIFSDLALQLAAGDDSHYEGTARAGGVLCNRP